MPYETFYNLPEAKRNNLVRAAVEEFAARGYQGGSIQEIADRAGVAKGSIYQYFQNKKELFLFIFDLAVEEKVEYINKLIMEYSCLPFSRLLEKLFLGAARKAAAEPELYQLYNALLSGVSGEIEEEIRGKLEQVERDYYLQMLREAVKKGEIREDISLELAVFVVYTFLRDLGELFGRRLESISWDALEREVKQVVEVLKNGLEA